MKTSIILNMLLPILTATIGYFLGKAETQPLKQTVNILRALLAKVQVDTQAEIAELKKAYLQRIKIVCNNPKTHEAQDSDYILISDPLGIDNRTQPRLLTYEADTVALQRAKDMPHLCK